MNKIKTPKDLTLYFHAHAAFQQALSLADLLIALKLDDRDPRAAILFGSICGYYGRPFKKSWDIGSLPETVIPPMYKSHHDQMLHLRDKVFLHTDGKAELSDGRKINELKFITDSFGEISSVENKISIPKADTFRHMHNLIKLMSDVMKAFIQDYLTEVETDLSLEPDSIYSLKISEDDLVLNKEH